MSPADEQRTELRYQPKRPLRVEYVDHQPVIQNISLVGAFIEDNHVGFSRGRVLRIKIRLEDQRAIAVEAMVRRVEERRGIAVEFVGMSSGDRAELRRYITNQSKGAQAPELP